MLHGVLQFPKKTKKQNKKQKQKLKQPQELMMNAAMWHLFKNIV